MSSSIHCSMNDGLVLTGGARKNMSYKHWRHAHRDWGPTQLYLQAVEPVADLDHISTNPERRRTATKWSQVMSWAHPQKLSLVYVQLQSNSWHPTSDFSNQSSSLWTAVRGCYSASSANLANRCTCIPTFVHTKLSQSITNPSHQVKIRCTELIP